MGTPRVLILSLSGIRCADVVRAVRDVPRPGGEIAKVRMPLAALIPSS